MCFINTIAITAIDDLRGRVYIEEPLIPQFHSSLHHSLSENFSENGHEDEPIRIPEP